MIIYTQTDEYEVLYGIKSEVFYVRAKDKEELEPVEFKYAAEAIDYAEENYASKIN